MKSSDKWGCCVACINLGFFGGVHMYNELKKNMG